MFGLDEKTIGEIKLAETDMDGVILLMDYMRSRIAADGFDIGPVPSREELRKSGAMDELCDVVWKLRE